jgi:hypothetical protein
MKVAFYKAASKPFPAKIWSLLIAQGTDGPFSHCELVFDDWKGIVPASMNIQNLKGPGNLCFSSSETDGGTRFKIIDLKPKHWVLVDLPHIEPVRALWWCKEHDGLKYDWRGLRGFVMPWETPDPKDLFCSECVVECGQDQGEFWTLTAGKTSPNDLARFLKVIPPERIMV